MAKTFDFSSFKDISRLVILTDMDGTFLPSSKIPSERSLGAVKYFENRGGRFSIATGRALHAAEKYFRQISLNFPAILCNGGLVFDSSDKKGLMSVYTPPKTREIVSEILRDNPNIGCEILTLDTVYVPQLNDTERDHIRICETDAKFCPLEQITDGNWYKVLFADTPENTDRLEEYVKSKNFTDVDFVRSADLYYEILPKNVSKGYGVRFLKSNFCSPGDTVICVGDYYNDLEMLSEADIAVCPANAVEGVKEICDLVLQSTCEQDALAELIYKLLGAPVEFWK